MVKMNEAKFLKELKKININLTNNQIAQFQNYADFLLEYNQKTNLTAIKTIEEVYLKHFYDSLTLVKIADISNGTLLDIGTGAGFPGLVLAIAFPNLKVTLLDSNNKKIKFLEECLKILKLNNVSIVYQRAEDYAHQNREKYDFITSRAVAELRILLELGLPCLKVNGSFLIMKANVSKEEQENSIETLKILNSTIDNILELDLPHNEGHRTLIKIIKKVKTNNLYPRTYDKIKKKPLK